MKLIDKLTLPALVDSLQEVIDFLEENLEKIDCPMKIMISLDVALEEMYVNIASYAYPNENADGQGMVSIELYSDDSDSGCYIRLIDSGIKYNPLEKEDPDVTLSVDERGVGGLGIYMVKMSMDEVSYKYEDGHNIFTMYKKFI